MRYMILAIATGLWGTAVMWAVAPLHPEMTFIAPALGGALLAGLICAPLFLRPGWGWSVLAAGLASGLGGALGGAGFALVDGAINPLQATLIGAAFVASALLQVSLALLIWLAGAVAMHVLARRLGQPRLTGISP